MKAIRKHFLASISLLLLMTGCTTVAVDTSERIMGDWQSEVAGFPLVVSYTADTVQVKGSGPVPYTLSGNELRFADGGSQVRIVTFPSRDEMVQTDPLTGTEHRFTRP